MEATRVPVHPRVDSLVLINGAEISTQQWESNSYNDTGDPGILLREKPDPGRYTINIRFRNKQNKSVIPWEEGEFSVRREKTNGVCTPYCSVWLHSLSPLVCLRNLSSFSKFLIFSEGRCPWARVDESGFSAELLQGQDLPSWASCHTPFTYSQFGLCLSPGSGSMWAGIRVTCHCVHT